MTLPETVTVGFRLAPLAYAILPGIAAFYSKSGISTAVFGTTGLLFLVILSQTVGNTEFLSLQLLDGAPMHCYALGRNVLPLSTLVYAYWVFFFSRAYSVQGTSLYNLPVLIVGLTMGVFDWIWMIKSRCYRVRETAVAVVLAAICGWGWNAVVESRTRER